MSKESLVFETPDGTVSATSTEVSATPQKIIKVTGNELNGLHNMSNEAPDFVNTYWPGDSTPSLKDYDMAFKEWQVSKSPQHNSQQVVEILGAYLGNLCVERLNMEWVTVTDEYGTDYAVKSMKANIISFPFSTVLKRIENNENEFMYGVFYTIKGMLESGEYDYQ